MPAGHPVLTVLIALLAGACASGVTPAGGSASSPAKAPPGAILPPPDFAPECPAAAYRGLVGQPIAAVTLPKELRPRIIRPGDAVTEDYRPGRTNIDLDSQDRIARVWCG